MSVTTPTTRAVKKVWKSEPTIEGAGVHLRRAFGFYQVPQFDPFLLLDDFRSDAPDDYLAGFPWHPHRGIETITYVLDGEVEHQDSLGHGGVIGAGDIQWMTAGSGILHQEMPKGDDKGRMYGFQLWANLPARHKMMAPRYRDVGHNTIPTVKTPDGSTVRVVAGEVQGVRGPVRDVMVAPEYLDVTVPAGRTFRHAVPEGQTVFAYVVDGEGYFEPNRDAFAHENVGVNYFDMAVPCPCGRNTLILFKPDGAQVAVTTVKTGVRFLLVSGKPLGEPVAWYGPIVMNTQQELKTAFEEFQSGAFIKEGSEPPGS